jgi:hypothetical protein
MWGEWAAKVRSGIDAIIIYAFLEPCKALDFSGCTAKNLSMVKATSIMTPIPVKKERRDERYYI